MRHAFSLIELSIVLVIIGLLTGGILTGKSLIEASQTRKIGTDVQKYVTTVYAFRDKYFQYPGDMNNATRVWGASDPTWNVCRMIPSVGTLTCDGNGDGMIGIAPYQGEMLLVWKHLANAGLIGGDFTGVTGDSTGTYLAKHVPGSNCPAGAVDGTCYGFTYSPAPVSGHSYLWPGEYGHLMNFGKPGNYDPLNPALSAERTWNIDTKIDDGMPGMGRMITRGATAMPHCTNETNTLNYRTATYLLTDPEPLACAFYYRKN
jgi:prepilin-type N-terminal cleavage/methylation domain-containing protein